MSIKKKKTIFFLSYITYPIKVIPKISNIRSDNRGSTACKNTGQICNQIHLLFY